MQKHINEVKYGALLSYILIAANAIFSLLIAPFILGHIGESEYGVYKTIASMTASISILELGLGGTLQRYIAKFRAEGELERAYNFSAMGLLQAAVLGFAVLIIGIPLYFSLEPAYSATFTAAEMVRAKQLLIILVCYVALHIFENVISGIVSGYNKFVFTNSMKLGALGLKVALYAILLPLMKNAVAIVLTSVLIELLIISVECIYLKFVLHHKIKLTKWDNELFKESFAYTMLLFIQSIIIQFNGNVDNIVIGAVIGTSAVTVYSFAIQLYNMYEQCATAVSGVLLPTVIRQLHDDDSPEKIEEMTVRYGRIQWMLLGAALFGFLCLGREFFRLWLGAKLGPAVEDCWYLALILMIPVTFPLIVNVFLAVLKAKNLLRFRTVAMAYSLVFNIILTVIGTRIWGYWAAAVGTAMSTIVGSVISLNIYYHKKLKVGIFRVYFRIFRRTTICLIAAFAVTLVLNHFISGSWLTFAAKVAAFAVVYLGMLFFYGLSKDERNELLHRK